MIDIKVGDYTQSEPKPLPSLDETGLRISSLQLDSIPWSVTTSPLPSPRMNLRSVTYYTAKEVVNGFDYDSEGMEDENDITTDSSDESDNRFDSSNDDEFDPETRGDYNTLDDFIDID